MGGVAPNGPSVCFFCDSKMAMVFCMFNFWGLVSLRIYIIALLYHVTMSIYYLQSLAIEIQENQCLREVVGCLLLCRYHLCAQDIPVSPQTHHQKKKTLPFTAWPPADQPLSEHRCFRYRETRQQVSNPSLMNTPPPFSLNRRTHISIDGGVLSGKPHWGRKSFMKGIETSILHRSMPRPMFIRSLDVDASSFAVWSIDISKWLLAHSPKCTFILLFGKTPRIKPVHIPGTYVWFANVCARLFKDVMWTQVHKIKHGNHCPFWDIPCFETLSYCWRKKSCTAWDG